MYYTLPKINPQKEKETIVKFIQDTLKKNGFKNIVIGLSGGVDSTTVFYLLKQAVPKRNIISINLDYYNNIHNLQGSDGLQINPIVDKIQSVLKIDKIQDKDRFGNIMARVRMIILFDLAKKYNGLVCGTENKSEHYLGYFTRFGDAASDIEPIQHLYKTQVYELANYLKVPKKIVNQKPTANLWPEQTDENQFGFTYKEADIVLYLHFKKKLSVEIIIKSGFSNAKKIIDWVKQNQFKQEVPYSLGKS